MALAAPAVYETTSSVVPEESLDILVQAGSSSWEPETIGSTADLSSATSSASQPSSCNPTSSCIRAFKDAEGYNLICFCTGCQDEFLAQIHVDGVGKDLRVAPQTIGHIDRSNNDASTCSPSRSSTSSVQARWRRSRCHDRKTAGISKSDATSQKARPDVLLSQLEEALYEDNEISTDFKWKASVLFDELKKLIENESTNQQLGTVISGSQIQTPLLSYPQSQKRKSNLKSRRTQQEGKMFLCTSPDCPYSTNSAMDWRRHEETHWPQKRYMCINCPPIDMQTPKCSFCMLSLSPAIDVATHYLECDSARRNGRTFARKDKLSEHLQKEHSMPQSSAMSRALISAFRVDSGWPKRCNFCDVLFESWDYRTQHLIEDHFKRGADHRMWQRSSSHSATTQYYSIPSSYLTQNLDDEFTRNTHEIVYRRDHQGTTSFSETCNFDTEFTQEPAQGYGEDLLSGIFQQDQFRNFSYNRPSISPETLAKSQSSQDFGKVSKLELEAANEPPSVKAEHQISKRQERQNSKAGRFSTGEDTRNLKSQSSVLQPSTVEVPYTHDIQSSSDLPTMFNMTKPLDPITPKEIAEENRQRELQEQITMQIAQQPRIAHPNGYRRRASAPKPLWKKVVHGVHEAVVDGKNMLLKERPKFVDAGLSSAMAAISIKDEPSVVANGRTDVSWLGNFAKKGSRIKPAPPKGPDSEPVVKASSLKAISLADDDSSLSPLKLES